LVVVCVYVYMWGGGRQSVSWLVGHESTLAFKAVYTYLKNRGYISTYTLKLTCSTFHLVRKISAKVRHKNGMMK